MSEQTSPPILIDASGAISAMGLMLRVLIDTHPDPKALSEAWLAYTSTAHANTNLEVIAGETTPDYYASLKRWLGIFDSAIARANDDR